MKTVADSWYLNGDRQDIYNTDVEGISSSACTEMLSNVLIYRAVVPECRDSRPLMPAVF